MSEFDLTKAGPESQFVIPHSKERELGAVGLGAAIAQTLESGLRLADREAAAERDYLDRQSGDADSDSSAESIDVSVE